ncbi:MAG TPA: hypothetical protein VM096_06245 [Vicinamibacterales bacterium]|nr:hypothetical protein [Vicinamibacterales bacterium]
MALLIMIVVTVVVGGIAVGVSKTAITYWERARDREARMSADARASSRLEARWKLVGIILAVTAAAAAFAIIRDTPLQQTSALFIGIPVILAIATVFVPTGESAVGAACKAVTIGLLISLLFLGEGMICVAMSAPLFYIVAILMGKMVDEQNEDEPRGRSRLYSCAVLMAIAPMTVEGVVPMTTIDRNVVVSETRVVAATPEAIAGALVASPRFDRKLPFYLGIGFPRPTTTRIDGTTWAITMRGGEMRLNGMEPRSGNLVMAVDDGGPGFISWRAVSDNSHMRHFLSWQASRVEWHAIDPHHTRVTWTIAYRRDLDPAWYFGPMERYAVHLAAGYLIDAVATP